jgi:hypothetical protein
MNVARTGNSAGFIELTDDLARQKAVAEGNQAQQNQLAFTNTAFQCQMSALQGLSGVDSNLLGRTLGSLKSGGKAQNSQRFLLTVRLISNIMLTTKSV